jgi:CDP-glycerol glycerophosphotransferase (TagB/SpsB family)
MNFLKIFRFLLYPLYALSFLFPRDKNIWVFGGGYDKYSENAKEFFIYTSTSNSDIIPIWITGDKNLYHKLTKKEYKVAYRWSLKGIYCTLRAKYYFYNIYPTDINFYTSGNAILVNLWHGIPLKNIEFDIHNGSLNKWYHGPFSYIYMFLKPYIFKRPNFILSSSETVSRLFSSAFRIKNEYCLPLGYPRNDIFFNHISFSTSIISTNTNTVKNLIYMPTWRKNNKNFINDAIPNFDKLNTILLQHQLHLYIKPHPMTNKITSTYSNISFLDPHIDVYNILSNFDFLITDYSSIYFDYLLLDKEIIFYPFDYQDYVSKDRNLYFDYHSITPGKKVYNFEDLLSLLAKLDTLNYEKERKKVKNTFWRFHDGDASKRLFNYFSTHIENNK